MAEWVDAGKVGITPKGEFDLSTAYEKNDLVSYQSYAFLCQQNCTGIAPVIGTVTEYWQPFGSSVEGDNTTTEIVDGKITVKDYVSKTEVDGISGDVTDLSGTVDAVIEQIGSEEELSNLPDPAGSLAKNITQINSNLSDKIIYSETITQVAGALNGNADSNIDIVGLKRNVNDIAIIPLTIQPSTSWDTRLEIFQINNATMKALGHTFGTLSQTYTIKWLHLYTNK